MNFRGWQAAKMVMMALIVHLFGGQMDCQLALMHYLFAEARLTKTVSAKLEQPKTKSIALQHF